MREPVMKVETRGLRRAVCRLPECVACKWERGPQDGFGGFTIDHVLAAERLPQFPALSVVSSPVCSGTVVGKPQL